MRRGHIIWFNKIDDWQVLCDHLYCTAHAGSYTLFRFQGFFFAHGPTHKYFGYVRRLDVDLDHQASVLQS